MINRTPEQHRSVVDAWAEDAPKQDHKIFGRKLRTDTPRLRELSGLKSLLAMRNRPDGVAEDVPEHPPELAELATNWRAVPANDNTPPAEGFGVERAVEYEPSMKKIERALEGLTVTYRQEPMMLRRPDGSNAAAMAAREVHAIVESDVKTQNFAHGNGKRQSTVYLAGFRFSDGTQTEKGHKLVLGKAVAADIRMPVGAMLGCREKSARDKGAESDESGSDAHYRWMVPARVAKRVAPAETKVTERQQISKLQASRMLEEAIANTAQMPTIKFCPDGYPYLPARLSQLFIGGKKGKKGESGSLAWEDISTKKENRETFARTLDAMSNDHMRVLTEAVSATSLAAIGQARGFKGRHAIAAGRRLLIAANDNFKEAMRLAEAAGN